MRGLSYGKSSIKPHISFFMQRPLHLPPRASMSPGTLYSEMVCTRAQSCRYNTTRDVPILPT